MTISVNSPDPVATSADHADEHHGDFKVTGLIIFLASESLMFVGLFVVYLMFMSMNETWPPEGTEVELLLPTVNTVILVSSSFVINLGTKAIKQNQAQQMRLWFLVTALMGATFLAGQVYEYVTLGYGLNANIFANCFYLMTGFHGLHVFVGVLLILAVWFRSLPEGHYGAESHAGVEVAEIYWHFVDIIWIILFTLLYVLTLF